MLKQAKNRINEVAKLLNLDVSTRKVCGWIQITGPNCRVRLNRKDSLWNVSKKVHPSRLRYANSSKSLRLDSAIVDTFACIYDKKLIVYKVQSILSQTKKEKICNI
jgi:hypothetical protein